MQSLYEILKTSNLDPNIASDGITALRARMMMSAAGEKTYTLTGVPPLSFKSNGKPLISWSMLGNGQQTGTPTPDAPIMPTFCGVRTANLFDISTVEKGRIDNGVVGYVSQTSSLTIEGESVSFTTTATYRGVCSGFFEIPEGTEAISFNFTRNEALGMKFVFYDDTKIWLNQDYTPALSDIPPATANVPSGAKYVRLSFTGQIVGGYSYVMSNIMLNSGSTSLPYEPYGLAEKITCAGQTVPVYLGQTQTVRRIKKLVLTGEENILDKGNRVYSIMIAHKERVAPLCTHYVGKAVGGWNTIANHEIITAGSSVVEYRVRDDEYQTLADFKAYLAEQYANGTPVTIWCVLSTPETAIVNEPLCKIGDYADELHSSDTTVSVPTVKGQNTLAVDTELQPSEMTITYNG